ncbi:MAG: HipA domain-containing protein [Vicinamibacteria bacterium]
MESLHDGLIRGALSAADLRESLAISPATLMRMVRKAGPTVVRTGRGRATRYALRQPWPSLDDSRFPMFRITETGEARSAGELTTLAASQSLWMPDGRISYGLPIELSDAQPSGFLGRHFAANHADLRLPARLIDWSDHHILIAMSRRGEDLPGNLMVGEESFTRWQTQESVPATRDEYPALAEATIAGHPPGSSAGGERPKFGVRVEGQHMLVKFAARGGATDVVAQRWCDLIVLEGVALDIVGSRGISAARTRVIDTPSHRFLESERFDRVGVRGRRGVLSLAAIHDDLADPWARAATLLREAGRLLDVDARHLRWLDAFGALIGNTDRHQHNVLFFAPDTHQGTLRLAPAFDQVSMMYAPTSDGQVPPRVFTVPNVRSDTLDVWDDARESARQFWGRAGEDARLSDDFRVICSSNARLLGVSSRAAD